MKIMEYRSYRVEMSVDEFKALRKLIAEGLTVAEEVTPVMESIGESFGIKVAVAPSERLLAQSQSQDALTE